MILGRVKLKVEGWKLLVRYLNRRRTVYRFLRFSKCHKFPTTGAQTPAPNLYAGWRSWDDCSVKAYIIFLSNRSIWFRLPRRSFHSLLAMTNKSLKRQTDDRGPVILGHPSSVFRHSNDHLLIICILIRFPLGLFNGVFLRVQGHFVPACLDEVKLKFVCQLDQINENIT